MPFELRPVDVVEEEAGAPVAVAGENALRKAVAAKASGDEGALGVDTLVAIDFEIWGKPPSEQAARDTLRRLGGRTHEVVSGVALIAAGGAVRAATATTLVTFRPLDEPMIDWYVRSGGRERRSGRSARAPTRSRAAAARSSSGSRATTSTSSGCRSGHCSGSGRSCCRWR